MAYYEGAYPQLLLGVSQQQPKDRLPGQVQAQVNMTSDPAFGIRRRSPVDLLNAPDARYALGLTSTRITDLSGQTVIVVLNAKDGTADVTNLEGEKVATLESEYLVADSQYDLQTAAIEDALYIVNTNVQPTEVDSPDKASYPEPGRSGFLYITSSAYSKRYDLNITRAGFTGSVSYTTPEGADPSEVAEATVEYIAGQLIEKAEALGSIGTGNGFSYYQEGGYIGITSDDYDDIVVTTTAGDQYAKASGSGVTSTDDLPARVPGPLDNLIVAVGAGRTRTYYRWDAETQSWLEDASYDALTVLDNMPLRLFYDGSDWQLEEVDWERRTSGDTENNPTLRFVQNGITGMGAFQGRLVLLSNEFVCMSASNRPQRFYRSSVESLVADDPIEIAGQSSLSSPYRQAVIFNKDLVLFSDRYQGLIPGGAAVTPSNATVAVVSHYECVSRVLPTLSGQSMFFPSRRSRGYGAVWEMTASPYVDSSVVAQDVTSHIPTYLDGDPRFMVTSPSTGIMVVGLADDPNTLLVHEYLWSGNEKQQQAWHKWTFPHNVLDAQFNGDRLYILFRMSGNRPFWGVLDLRVGSGESSRQTARLDFRATLTCTTAGRLNLPTSIQDEAWGTGSVVAFKLTGAYPFMPTTTTREGNYLGVVGANPGDTYIVGRPYTSELVPTAPVIRDRNDIPVTTQRQQLHKYVVQLDNTGEFNYSVSDKYHPEYTQTVSPLKFGSPELGVGVPLVADGQVYIPARVDMPTSELRLWTDDVYDLNITNLEYGYRFQQRYGRRA